MTGIDVKDVQVIVKTARLTDQMVEAMGVTALADMIPIVKDHLVLQIIAEEVEVVVMTTEEQDRKSHGETSYALIERLICLQR